MSSRRSVDPLLGGRGLFLIASNFHAITKGEFVPTRTRGLVAVAATVALAGSLLIAVQPASGAQADTAIVIDWDNLDSFKDVNGHPLTIDSDVDTGQGAHVLSGTNEAGTPFNVTIYYGDEVKGDTAGVTLDPSDADDAEDVPVGSTLPFAAQESLVLEETVDLAVVPIVVVAATPSTLTTAWLAPEDATSFRATLDETLTIDSEEPNVTFESLNPDTSYSLNLESVSPQPDQVPVVADLNAYAEPASESDPAEGSGNESGDLPTASPSPTAPDPEPVDPVAVPDSVRSSVISATTLAFPKPDSNPQERGMRALESSPALTAAEVHSTEFNYRTFIPWTSTHSEEASDIDRAIVTACMISAQPRGFLKGASPTDLTFRGDARGFRQPAADGPADYRTMVNLKADWDTNTAAASKQTGYTNAIYINDNDRVAATRHASTGKIEIKSRVADSQILDWYRSFSVKHIANDPFCPSAERFGAIYYDIDIELTRSGVVTMTGFQASMPNHEAYVRWNNSPTWSTLLTRDAVGLICLVAGPLKKPIIFRQEDGSLGGDLICGKNIDARISISQDRYVALSENFFLTKSGRISGVGNGSVVSPYADGVFFCEAVAPVPAAPLPGGVRVSKFAATRTEAGSTKATILALGSDKRLYTWGGGSGVMGRESDGVWDVEWGTTPSSFMPTPLAGEFVDVSILNGAAAAVTTSNTVKTWGEYEMMPAESAPWASPIVQASAMTAVPDGGAVKALDDQGRYIYWDGYRWSVVDEGPYTTMVFAANGTYALDDAGQLYSDGVILDAPGTSPQGSAWALEAVPANENLIAEFGEDQHFTDIGYDDRTGQIGLTADFGGAYVVPDWAATTRSLSELTVVPTPPGLVSFNGVRGITDDGQAWNIGDQVPVPLGVPAAGPSPKATAIGSYCPSNS